ncbi:putative inorganic phosphate cotransporter isoform X2 [Schistocerca gregaria]|uniref:putative inorganic phosphate cotransporter isoform X2 n=1 Tax=Schistocerca gregaria TaxID=7010 RepID=UPI00211DCACD|nr:putative inorganic phosphate cotransporter isoform X2 [Schistocerca gregaria]
MVKLTPTAIRSALGYRHLQVFLMFLGVTFAYALRTNLSIAIVSMTDKNSSNPNFPEYDWDPQTRSTILSSFFWGYVLFQIPAGQLAERFGANIFFSSALFITGALSLLTPVAADLGDWPLVCACRVLQGASQGFLYPSIHTLLSLWVTPEESGLLGTIVYAGAQLGTIISMPLSGVLASSSLGWPSVFYIFGGIAVAWGILCAIVGASSPAKHKFITGEERKFIEESHTNRSSDKRYSTPWFSIITSPPMIALTIVHACQCWGFWTLLTEMPTYMADILDFDISKNGLLSALPYLVMWLLSFVMSPVSFWLQRREIISLTASRKLFNSIAHYGPAAALIGVALAPVGNSDLVVALLTIAVGLNAGTFVGFQINHVDLSPNFAGTLMGITNGLGNIMSIVGPLVVGVILGTESTREKWQIVFYIASGIYLFGNTIFVIFGSAVVQPWNEPKKSKENTESAPAEKA